MSYKTYLLKLQLHLNDTLPHNNPQQIPKWNFNDLFDTEGGEEVTFLEITEAPSKKELLTRLHDDIGKANLPYAASWQKRIQAILETE
jgi:hypothetical protein